MSLESPSYCKAESPGCDPQGLGLGRGVGARGWGCGQCSKAAVGTWYQGVPAHGDPCSAGVLRAPGEGLQHQARLGAMLHPTTAKLGESSQSPPHGAAGCQG